MTPVTSSGVRVLVTGGGGMIGSKVLPTLLAEGHTVATHLGLPGDPYVPPPTGIRAVVGDITDLALVRKIVSSVDAVVHLAGPPSVAASFADPRGCVQAHVVGTSTVLQACREVGVHRLVYVSSAEVYGRHEHGPVPETAPTLPRSPYGAAKLGAEALVRAEAVHGALSTVVLRPFSVYGPRSPARSLLGTLVRQALDADAVEPSSLAGVRDYVHVADVARAVAAALLVVTADLPEDGLVVNIASGTGTSVGELAALVVRAGGRALPVRESVDADRPAEASAMSLVADIGVATARLGWRPRVPLPEGVRAVVEAARDHRRSHLPVPTLPPRGQDLADRGPNGDPAQLSLDP